MGVALVASAAKAMASKLCAGWLLSSISTIAVVVAYYWPKAYTFPCLIIAGGLVSLLHSRFIAKTPPPKYAVRAAAGAASRQQRAAVAALGGRLHAVSLGLISF